MPLAGHHTLSPVETLEQQRREANSPSVDSGVVDRNAPFGHHLLKITKAQIVGQVPAHAKQDHRLVKLTPLKHLNPPKWSMGPCQSTGNQKVATHPACLLHSQIWD
jgi:hypothetical protein